MKSRTSGLGLALGISLLAFGCARSEPAQTGGTDLPPAGADQQYDVSLPGPPEAEARQIELDLDEGLDGCGLQQAHFPYDESTTLPPDHVELRVIADCLNAPPYADTNILLVGRADERGPDDYNRRLGAQRAKYVKGVLMDFGVAGDRISTTSQGEQKAKGSQEAYSHGYDRRVDVVQLRVQRPR